MKRILIAFSTLLLVAITSVSCNKNSAKETATNWLTSFYHLDYETAKTLSTEDTKTLLSSLQQFTSMVPDSNKKEMKKIAIKVKDVKETGDTADATYTVSDTPDKDQHIKLIKTNGKWLVQFTKNDQMGEMDDQSGAGAETITSDSTGVATPPSAPMPDSNMH